MTTKTKSDNNQYSALRFQRKNKKKHNLLIIKTQKFTTNGINSSSTMEEKKNEKYLSSGIGSTEICMI